jgi:phosphate transport system substrate-binding protein
VGEEFVEYSPEAAAAVVEASPRVAGRPDGSLAPELVRDRTHTGTYPVVLVSYQLPCTTYEDEEKADLVGAFLQYVASEDGQAAAADSRGQRADLGAAAHGLARGARADRRLGPRCSPPDADRQLSRACT